MRQVIKAACGKISRCFWVIREYAQGTSQCFQKHSARSHAIVVAGRVFISESKVDRNVKSSLNSFENEERSLGGKFGKLALWLSLVCECIHEIMAQIVPRDDDEVEWLLMSGCRHGRMKQRIVRVTFPPSRINSLFEGLRRGQNRLPSRNIMVDEVRNNCFVSEWVEVNIG